MQFTDNPIRAYDMITISTTEFHNHFAEYLDRVTQGETVNIAQDHQEIAQMIPSKNWRNKMTIQPQLQVSSEQLIKPLEDVLNVFWK